MNPDRWERIEELYHAALARQGEGRAAFLANACQDDEELRREVESLVRQAGSASGLLDHPAVDVSHIVARVGTTLAGIRQVGNYRLLSLLGAGGMGQVYLAEDTRLLRKVAIKFLPVGAVDDERARRRLIHEARAAATLDHPNICAIYEVGEADGHHFIAMQYVDGETLSDRLSTGRMDLRAALDVATQVARALAEAHNRGIVHRDIKPQNIMLSQQDHVTVLDFGLAKVMSPFGETNDPISLSSEPGTAAGTVPYMSPEQLRGNPLDHRTDIFSLGIVLQEIVSGVHPFAADNTADTISAILTSEPRRFDSEGIDLPAELQRIIHKCLEKDPDRRYQTTGDLVIDLEAILHPLTGAPAIGRPIAQTPAIDSSDFSKAASLLLAAAGSFVVLLVILLVLTGGNLRERFRSVATPNRIQSLAVLPLTNLSRDPDQEYFADGMTEALITDLAQISGLRVISRTSVMMYNGAQKPLPQIGKELNVEAVLVGSVQTSGTRVLVTTQLVHAASDRHLWAKSYERDLKDVLSLQREIARTVLAEVRVALSPDEAARLAKAHPVDPEVHELYLRGRFHFNKGIEDGLEKGIEYFDQALAKAPTYAPAHAGLAASYGALSDLYRAPVEVLPKAKAAAQRALELDEGLAEAHVSLGTVHFLWDRDWAGAERELKRAIELKPSSSDAHAWYALLLTTLGRHDEAVAESRKAQQYDPFSLWANESAGMAHFYARQFDQAIVEWRKAVEIEAHRGGALAGVAISHAAAGRKTEALAAAEKAIQVDEGPFVLANAGAVYARWGDQAQARRILSELDEIAKRRYVCPYPVSIVHLMLGEKDKTFALLERGFQERSACMVWTKIDPQLDPLRSDPRYTDLIRRLGFRP
jgi:serine/threonine-protein kinase